MRKAFEKERGPLTDTTVDEAEQEGRAHLFAGAYAGYRNPHAHRDIAIESPEEALEIIMLANHLMRILDRRKAVIEAATEGATTRGES